MNFEVIHMWSPDCDIETFNPYEDPHNYIEDINYEFPECWIILLEMTIGYNGVGQNYHCYVCTIEYIRRELPFFPEKTLIVNEWNLNEIKETINNIVKHCIQEKPENTFKELSKCFYWEFDNYQS